MEGKNANIGSDPPPRRRRAPCSSCRRRKSKCDNRQPQCSTCVAHSSNCHYENPPSLAYVRSLEAKIDRLMVEKPFTSQSDVSKGVEVRYQSSRTIENHDGVAFAHYGDLYQKHDQAHQNYSKRSLYTATLSNNPVEIGSQSRTPLHQENGQRSESDENCDRWVSEISVDSQGEVCYHNPTSAIYEAPSTEDRETSRGSTSPGMISSVSEGIPQQTDRISRSLSSNAAVQRQLEAIAMKNMSTVQNEISSETASELLEYHWCWIHPMFMFVYRPAFTRDMALSCPARPETPYFSETLLRVLLAHSSRFRVKDHQYQNSETDFMDALTKQAHLTLALRLTGPSSIPTIQALLQQSAREVAFGNSSQAWLFSGMAFRIAVDLGIHLPSDRLKGYVKTLTMEDIEIRKRLFWSCYNWDKAISLYLGRMPAFHPQVEAHVPTFMDDFTENDPWSPYYGPNGEFNDTTTAAYPERKGHMISCFTGLCRISTILNTMMLEIYGSTSILRTSDVESGSIHRGSDTNGQNNKTLAFVRISRELEEWYTELPDEIRLDTKNLPGVSPPLHIVSLNLLYHTTWILLHRPFIIGATDFENPAVQRSYQICVAATTSIHDLLELLTTTFGYSHTTYLNCYSTYIAATIAVLHFELQQDGRSIPVLGVPEEKLGLKFFLRVLQQSAKGMPALARSVEIVKRHIQAILDKRAKKYLDSLFFVNGGGDLTATQEHSAFPGMVNETHNPHGLFTSQSTNSNNAIAYTEMSTSGTSHTYPGLIIEGLPAFPGQNFNVGADFNIDQEISDPEMRAALLGLDSHLILQHESSDWDYGSFYIGDET